MPNGKNSLPSEQTHWYKTDGSPFYTMAGTNGKERSVTLRDAKKLGGIVPSVTTILKECYKPGLEMYKIDQAIMSALTLPRMGGELEADWVKRVKMDAKEHSRIRAEEGTAIHGYVQRGFELDELTDKEFTYYKAAVDETARTIGKQNWSCEKSFATGDYGGKVDLHTELFVLDIKTKNGSLDDVKLYDEHFMQLAAYRTGLDVMEADCGILFISTEGEAKLVMATREEIYRGRDMFIALLGYWYHKTGLGRGYE